MNIDRHTLQRLNNQRRRRHQPRCNHMTKKIYLTTGFAHNINKLWVVSFRYNDISNDLIKKIGRYYYKRGFVH